MDDSFCRLCQQSEIQPKLDFEIVGWEMGLEPTTTGITIRDSTN